MSMKGFQLEFFVRQDMRHGQHALWEWLLESARTQGIHGATVFAGTAGFGHHHQLRSAHFFELADQPMQITMVVTEEEATELFALLEQENVHAFYVKMPVEFGVIGEPGSQQQTP
jgi:PII-like signaling protein